MRGIEQMTDAASMGRILFFLPLGVLPNGSDFIVRVRNAG